MGKWCKEIETQSGICSLNLMIRYMSSPEPESMVDFTYMTYRSCGSRQTLCPDSGPSCTDGCVNVQTLHYLKLPPFPLVKRPSTGAIALIDFAQWVIHQNKWKQTNRTFQTARTAQFFFHGHPFYLILTCISHFLKTKVTLSSNVFW